LSHASAARRWRWPSSWRRVPTSSRTMRDSGASADYCAPLAGGWSGGCVRNARKTKQSWVCPMEIYTQQFWIFQPWRGRWTTRRAMRSRTSVDCTARQRDSMISR